MKKKKVLMTMEDVDRIKSATAKKNKGIITKNSFVAKAESIVAKRISNKN